MKEIRPGVEVLFASGYTTDLIQSKAVSEEGLQFIAKPRTPVELLRKVREVLDARLH